MVVVMKQLDRAEEAIEAIRSFRHLCPFESLESLNIVLVELYKRAGGIEDKIEMLQSKLKRMDEGIAFNGKRTKNARAQGKNVQISVEQERSRVLGNLAWAYMQQGNYTTAEEHYKNALALEPDKNKQCNLAVCLMHMNRNTEARHLLQAVRDSSGNKPMDESYAKSFERAFEMLTDLETQSILRPIQENDPRNTGDSKPSFFSKIKENQGGMIGTEVNPHEKLPKSASDKNTESRGKGTTTIAVIGECSIFLATDSRLTDTTHRYMVGTGCKILIVKARGQPVMPTIARHMQVCKMILRYVKRNVRRWIARVIYRSSKSIHMTAFYAMKYIRLGN